MKFQGTQVKISVLQEQPDITYLRGTINTESLEPSCRISPKTGAHLTGALGQGVKKFKLFHHMLSRCYHCDSYS